MLFSATLPEGIQRLRASLHAPARDGGPVGRLRGGTRDSSHLLLPYPADSAKPNSRVCSPSRIPIARSSSATPARKTGRVAEFLRRQGLGRRGHLVGSVTVGARERHDPHARRQHPFFGGHRRGGARNRHRKPALRDQLHLPGLARVVHPSHRSHRSRRPLGSCDIADWSHRGWVVLLSQAAVQDPARGASPAVRGGMRSKHEGESVLRLRSLLPGDASPEWRSLARRIMGLVTVNAWSDACCVGHWPGKRLVSNRPKPLPSG